MLARLGVAGVPALLTVAFADAAGAQAATPPADTLRLTPSWDVTRHQPRDAPLAFTLSHALRAEDGRVAVIVGRADLSAGLQVDGTRALLPLRGERLPSGDLEVVGYLVSASGEWRELGRFALRRLTGAGFESAAIHPTLDLQSDGQLKAGLPPGAPPEEGSGVHQDLTLSAGLDATLRRGGGEFGAQGLLLGASRTAARLRAAQLDSSAPPVDLASYSLRLTGHGLTVAAGHVGVGSHRYLAQQFRSRGVTAEARFAPGALATVAAVAGSEVVGWDDPTGLGRPSHRVLMGSLGVELAPSRPGRLRVDLTGIEGSLQPIPAFNQGAITDREYSRGIGAQLGAADPSGRLRLALGVARSRFTNPIDPTLNGDLTLVPVRAETRSARFGELTFDALRGARLGGITASLSLAARHERVDPQYRSVAASLQADREQNSLEANGALGPLQVQAGLMRARDNLDGVPSLLTTRTAGQSLNAALPVAQLLGAAPTAWWWPSLTMAWQGVSQVGGATPVNGGFRFAFQVPDQRTTNLVLGAAWQLSASSLAWRYQHSLVDNRQPERERSDFATTGYGATLGLTASSRLTAAADLFRETLQNIELGQRARTDRLALQVNWRPFGHTALSGTYSLVTTDDQTATQRAKNVEFRVEGSQGFNLYARPQDGSQARVFLRYARAGSALRLAGEPQPVTRQWSLHGGLSLRLF